MKSIYSIIVVFLASTVFFMDASYAREYEYAGTYAVPEHQDGFTGAEYEIRAGKKLGRGLKNFFLGWLEIPQGVKSEAGYRRQEYLPVGMETFFVGLFKGTGRAIGRMGVGVYETFTFPYAQEPILQEMEEWWY